MEQQVDAPTSISGTVLIRAGTLTGYELGSVALSPFQPFMHEVPVAIIDHGVIKRKAIAFSFVYGPSYSVLTSPAR
jgi:hypothetical protein